MNKVKCNSRISRPRQITEFLVHYARASQNLSSSDDIVIDWEHPPLKHIILLHSFCQFCYTRSCRNADVPIITESLLDSTTSRHRTIRGGCPLPEWLSIYPTYKPKRDCILSPLLPRLYQLPYWIWSLVIGRTRHLVASQVSKTQLPPWCRPWTFYSWPLRASRIKLTRNCAQCHS